MTLSSKLTNLSIAQRVFPLVARKLTALRPVPWQRRHRGSWAPAFAGETKGERGGIGKTRRAQSGGELSHRLPSERRDPGTTELWTATKRASNRHGLRSTEGAGFSRAPKHRAGGISTALRSIPVAAAPLRLLGPRFRGGNDPTGRTSQLNAEGPIWRRTLSSSSQRTPGPRDHRALDGNQEDIEPPQPPRHGGYFLSRALKHRAGGKLTALRSAP